MRFVVISETREQGAKKSQHSGDDASRQTHLRFADTMVSRGKKGSNLICDRATEVSANKGAD